MSDRFDSIKYDEHSNLKHTEFLEKFKELEKITDTLLINGRAKALVLTKIEEAYMWVGKSIRDEQVGRLK